MTKTYCLLWWVVEQQQLHEGGGGGQQQVSEGASSTSGQLVRAPPQGYAFRYGDGRSKQCDEVPICSSATL